MKNTHPQTIAALVALGVLGIVGSTINPACAAGVDYSLRKEVSIGGEGAWDYLSVDAAGRRLYLSHGTKVTVVDIDKEAVAGEVPDTPGVHGIAIASTLGRAFSSNGRENKASIVDIKTLKTLSKVDTGENPDAILYEPAQREVYTFNGRSKSATVFEAATGKVVATIDLPGKPEFAAADPQAGRVYCNIEDKSEVAAIDIKTHKVINAWPIAPGESASGMAIDTAHHRLFLGCDNKLMVMMDSTSGKVVGSVAIGDGVDACAFDPDLQLAFSSCRDGTTTIAHEDGPDKLTVVQTLKTEYGARTMALDPKTHNIYLATAKYEAPTEGGGGRRRKTLPDTFKVLVYGIAVSAAK
jgi:DNA-binding beta-propeller fold protein YncE